jgi:LmbE family N-acetylglucosaminyl deacetylase
MANRIDAERAFVLAPHTDDGELGCGGTISRLLEEGVDVYYVAFSTCRTSLPEGWAPDTLEKELRAAALRLGIRADRLIVFDFEVRHFDRARQEILEQLVDLKRTLAPDLVFLPCPQDMHQDHVVIATEGIRAYKQCTVLAYELPWNNITFSTQCFIALEERHVVRKAEAVRCYTSQQDRPYADPAFIHGLARTRGVESGHRYAEAFQVIRWNIACAPAPAAESCEPERLGEAGLLDGLQPACAGKGERPRRSVPVLVRSEEGLECLP